MFSVHVATWWDQTHVPNQDMEANTWDDCETESIATTACHQPKTRPLHAPCPALPCLSWSFVWPGLLPCGTHTWFFIWRSTTEHECRLTVVDLQCLDTGPRKRRGYEAAGNASLSVTSWLFPAESAWQNRIFIKQEAAHHSFDALPQQGHIGRLQHEITAGVFQINMRTPIVLEAFITTLTAAWLSDSHTRADPATSTSYSKQALISRGPQ